ncbi:hypothetical protein CKO28_14280 [Rhodovibrio sodomensis]|uniref:Uncharacterized protein n=1 Tax=Rhodovibrio sodomensis TaxID=1088 RepID=A0ABS1DGS6_9PROT|nr:hypothetical protein [Rhodovibrio sodomensis]MBK1669201.1 hypothetical protein [Rhodovibrio sodomensis]
MIRTCGDFVTSAPGKWVLRVMFNYDHSDFTRDETWSEFVSDAFHARDNFGGADDKHANQEAWVNHIRRGMGVWSTGEKALALAVLHVIDYDWLADEFATVWNEHARQYESRAFAMLSKASGDFAEAVGACFARVDR